MAELIPTGPGPAARLLTGDLETKNGILFPCFSNLPGDNTGAFGKARVSRKPGTCTGEQKESADPEEQELRNPGQRPKQQSFFPDPGTGTPILLIRPSAVAGQPGAAAPLVASRETVLDRRLAASRIEGDGPALPSRSQPAIHNRRDRPETLDNPNLDLLPDPTRSQRGGTAAPSDSTTNRGAPETTRGLCQGGCVFLGTCVQRSGRTERGKRGGTHLGVRVRIRDLWPTP